MFAKINFHDEFYQKLKLLVLPITMQQFMLALVSATDAIMPVSYTHLDVYKRQESSCGRKFRISRCT